MSSPTELPNLKITDKVKEEEIKNFLSRLIIDHERQQEIKEIFLEEIRLGLALNPERPSSLQMENTYIRELADGTEHGSYLALDIGGTNLRVILLTLEHGNVINELLEYFGIPEHLRMGKGVDLFDYIAECIEKFLIKNKLTNTEYDLGFTFSFPMIQKGIDVGILTSWAKTFNCSGVVNENIVGLLNDAMKKKGILPKVTAILNDTTGTLVQGSFLDKRCGIGMILGTGCNACYIEKTSRIKKWTGPHTENEVIIDLEWGAFGDNGVLDDVLKTQWDVIVDEKSLLKNSFTFEKYIAGKYMGDIVREILVSLGAKGLFCKDSVCRQCLEVLGSLKTAEVSTIESEAFRGQLDYAKDVLISWGLNNVTRDDAKILQYVCALVSYRSVLLSSLLTSVLMKRVNKPHVTIAIDGSLFEHHPRFRPLMHHLISEFAPKKQFCLLLSRDGSGKGAGLVAAVVNRLKKQDQETGNA